jgi:hypothetical protein
MDEPIMPEAFQPSVMNRAFGEIVNFVSLRFRKTLAALETPLGGVLVIVIWPPFANVCFPEMIKRTELVDGL